MTRAGAGDTLTGFLRAPTMVNSARRSFLHRLGALEAHHRLGVALGVAVFVFAAAWRLHLPVRVIVGWDSYAASLLALAWVRILGAQPKVMVPLGDLTHISRKLLFLFVIVAACAGLLAVAFLGSAKGLPRPRLLAHVALTLGTIILSWLVLHTLFTLHYAYLYFCPALPGEAAREPGGLVFPEPTEPDYTDFAYFSFVIGMTSQVSDVQIASREIRRWALLHGVVSFGFNTVVLALSINTASSLL